MLIETIDVPQARDYVEKVMASYWIYQRLFGGPLKTLDALASGARSVPMALDYVAPPPQAHATHTRRCAAGPSADPATRAGAGAADRRGKQA